SLRSAKGFEGNALTPRCHFRSGGRGNGAGERGPKAATRLIRHSSSLLCQAVTHAPLLKPKPLLRTKTRIAWEQAVVKRHQKARQGLLPAKRAGTGGAPSASLTANRITHREEASWEF